MPADLSNKKVAILATNGFEQLELTEPQKALEEAGATTHVISPETGQIRGWDKTDWGDNVSVDVSLDSANPEEYDALVLPGGVMNPDSLRMNPKAVEFTKHFFTTKKPVAAICHGPWLLVEADVLHDRTVTSWPSLQTDIRNAGGTWIDQEVVVDNGLVTSRKPKDIPAFNDKMVKEIAEGIHS